MSSPIDQSAFKSVTLLPYPLATCGELPTDLLAAFNLAVNSCVSAREIVFAADQYSKYKYNRLVDILKSAIERIRREYLFHDAIKHVLSELIIVSEPASRFGGVCAHDGAIINTRELVRCVWDAADFLMACEVRKDSSKRMDIKVIDSGIERIADALGKKQWPDWGSIINACAVEASLAAARRNYVTKTESGFVESQTDLQVKTGGVCIYRHEKGWYSTDGFSPKRVTGRQLAILEAFHNHSGRMQSEMLHQKTNIPSGDLCKVFKQLMVKFGEAVESPEGIRGHGYCVRIKDLADNRPITAR